MNNEDIAKLIWHDILQNSKVPWTWGIEFRTVKTIKCGTAFYVRATIRGWIKILMNENGTFNTGFKPDGFESYLTYKNLIARNLIPTIDRIVKGGVFVDNLKSQGFEIAV